MLIDAKNHLLKKCLSGYEEKERVKKDRIFFEIPTLFIKQTRIIRNYKYLGIGAAFEVAFLSTAFKRQRFVGIDHFACKSCK